MECIAAEEEEQKQLFWFWRALLDSLYSLAFIRICLFVAQLINVDAWLVTA
jgi:hypothetical protein